MRYVAMVHVTSPHTSNQHGAQLRFRGRRKEDPGNEVDWRYFSCLKGKSFSYHRTPLSLSFSSVNGYGKIY